MLGAKELGEPNLNDIRRDCCVDCVEVQRPSVVTPLKRQRFRKDSGQRESQNNGCEGLRNPQNVPDQWIERCFEGCGTGGHCRLERQR